jgi:hypothetical protein
MRRRPPTGTLPLLCCCHKQFSSASSTSLHSGFRNRFSPDQFCSNALIVSVFPNRFDRKIYRAKFPTLVSFLLSILCFLYHFHFFFDAQNFSLLVTVAMLPRYQSAVKCRGRKVEGNFTHKGTTRNAVTVQPGIYVAS